MNRSQARVLVVDDEPTSSGALCRALAELGCGEVEDVRHGARALRELSERRYDLVITRWALPIMGGRELLRAVRESPELRLLPVVVATPVSTRVVAEAADAGVSAFLPLPWQRATLEDLLRLFIGPPPRALSLVPHEEHAP